MNQVHSKRRSFKLSLFRSLEKSLKGLCVESSDTKSIRLINSNVGFAMEVDSARDLGFPPNYALSTGRIVDHACVMFQDNHAWKIRDMTAAVALKTMYTSCMDFSNQQEPDLVEAHAPLGHGIVNSMNVHHCLARRGHVSESPIPVVVLAGRVRERKNPIGLRCVLGSVHLPEKIGDPFRFLVDRCIPFSEETGKLAVAIYLKTMCFGLATANSINNRILQGAVSLCCSTPLTKLQFHSSPVSDAARTSGSVKVSQADLFSIETAKNTLVQDVLSDLSTDISSDEYSTFRFFEPGPETVRCLVKVHCRSVHNSAISPEASSTAFKRLASANDNLKQEISKVLLASVYIAGGIWLVTVMRNLSPTYGLLSHDNNNFPPGSQLWAAFAKLVKNVLLPTADIHIVHTDIRFSPDKNTTYNILGSRNGDGSIDLRLIDFESLVVYGPNTRRYPEHTYAISMDHFSTRSAHEFLFWQVLWMAYAWCPRQAHEDTVTASDFVQGLFSEATPSPRPEKWDRSVDMAHLCSLSQKVSANKADTANEAVNEALNLLKAVFD
jgi:hypothetical protein